MATGVEKTNHSSVSETDNGENDDNDWLDCEHELGKESVNAKKAEGGKKKMVQLSFVPNKRPAKKRKKRFSSGNDQGDLADIHRELKHISDLMQDLVKKSEMKALVKSTVREVVSEMKPQIKKELEAEIRNNMKVTLQKEVQKEVESVEKERKKDMNLINDRFDGVDLDLIGVRQDINKQVNELHDMKKKLGSALQSANDALKLANQNQQYSQKNNIKILNWKEEKNESSETLLDEFISVMADAEVELDKADILAIHRVPGRKVGRGIPKPVVVKFLRTDVRLTVIKKRQEVMDTFTMIDHITERNIELLTKLRDNADIDSAWYYNCNIYAIDVIGERHKFYVGDNNDKKLQAIHADVLRADR